MERKILMKIFPAIDLYGGKAVRLLKGNYNEMTVYSDNPPEIAADFAACGAGYIHIVDLEGAKAGECVNFEVVKAIKETSGLFCEIGGGIRTMETAGRYISAGIDRVILGTAAVSDKAFLKEALREFKDKIAVGADLKDGKVAVKGWLEDSGVDGIGMCKEMQDMGVKTIICTDISKDGAMKGTNHELYRTLAAELSVNITASGGISSLEDVKRLAQLDLYAAIIGKAYYTKTIDLKEALKLTGCE